MRSFIGLFVLLSCNTPAPTTPPPPMPAPEPAPPPLPAVDPDTVTLDILDRATLRTLETSGHALADQLGAAGAPDHASAAWLHANVPAYAALAGALTEDVEAAAAQMRRDLVVEHRDALAWPAGNVGRRLDPRWLRAEEARWDLVAVVNRIDRADFSAGETCGDVRFIYRLGYQTDAGSSRLPVTLNVVHSYPAQEDCGAFARQWVSPAALADALAGLSLTQIEANAQVVRFPSGVETEFGGQALYLLEVLSVEDDATVTRLPLENTPDPLAVSADPALKAALRDWIAASLPEIDQGTHLLPDRFRARRALSWSTLGINRSANKPFTAIFSPDELPAVPEGLQTIGSTTGLLERLDNGSCTGCHQAGSTAGFHVLGEDDPQQSGITNRLQLPASPHFYAERSRRRAYLADLASGRTPDRHRQHSLAAPGYADASPGGSCIPEQHRADWRTGWGCADDLTCEVIARDPDTAFHFGQCVPATTEGLRSGMVCREGTVSAADPGTTGEALPAFNAHAYADTLDQKQRYGLPEDKRFANDRYNCRPPVIGVPLGRAYRSCTAAERALTAETLPDEICAIVGGSRFDRCVEEDFHSCLSGIVARGMVDGCSADRPCREDYICQQLPWQLDSVPTEAGKALAESGVGFCTPTYFLFQMRLDGHPVPTVAAN